MRMLKLFASMGAALIVAACAPFSMENERLGLTESSGDYHFQSYYLPKTILTATVTSGGNHRNITVGWEKVVDRDYFFKVNYERSAIHEDDLHVETTEKGFLGEVKAFSTDKTADIVEAGAKILMSSIGGTPFAGTVRSLPAGAMAETQLIVVQFDPFDSRDFKLQNRMLSGFGYCFAVYDRQDQPLPGSCNAAGVPAANDSWREPVAQAKPFRGVGFFYRRASEYRVVIHRRGGKGWVPMWSGWHQFEQLGPMNELRIDRGAFIKHEATLNFTEGALTKYTMKKPSEVLGFMAIPSVIVNTVVQIPGLQVSAAENANSLRERELNAREKELQLRQRQLQLNPLGTTADGQRLVYGPAGIGVRSATEFADVRALAGDKQRFMANCNDQKGLKQDDCDAAWQRRGGT